MLTAIKASEFTDRRASVRFDCNELCTLFLPNSFLRATVINISVNGIAVRTKRAGMIKSGDALPIKLRNFPTINASVLWSYDCTAGMRFEEPIARHFEIFNLLKNLEKNNV